MNEKPSARSFTRDLNVLHSFDGRVGRAGVGVSAYHLISEAAAQGCNVQVCSGGYDKIPPGITRRYATFELGPLRIPRRLFGALRAKRIHDRLTALNLHRAGKLDLVHCWPGSALLTMSSARKMGIHTFLHRPNCHTAYAYEITARIHEQLAIELPSWYSHSYNEEILSREEEEYRQADTILVPSPFVAKTFLERGFPPDKLAQIQYGFSPEKFPLPNQQELASRRQINVIFVGGAEPRKGLHLALEAWAASDLHKQGHFILCGKSDLFPSYSSHLARWMSLPNVINKNFVSNVAAEMSQCDILLLPSYEEGSAKVTYEARACGCVLVVSDCSGASCRHQENGLIHPAGDLATLTSHLQMLAEDHALLARLRANSIAGLAEITWQRAGAILVDAYRDKLCSASGNRSN